MLSTGMSSKVVGGSMVKPASTRFEYRAPRGFDISISASKGARDTGFSMLGSGEGAGVEYTEGYLVPRSGGHAPRGKMLISLLIVLEPRDFRFRPRGRLLGRYTSRVKLS